MRLDSDAVLGPLLTFTREVETNATREVETKAT